MPSELICDSIEKCFELSPEKAADFLIRQGAARVEPKRILYAFTPYVGSKDENAVENAIRYLRRACAEPNVSSLAARDLACHNLLMTLYGIFANKFEKLLRVGKLLERSCELEEVEWVERMRKFSVAGESHRTTPRKIKVLRPRYALTLLNRVDKKLV